jgi:ferredoxin-NADP reductase
MTAADGYSAVRSYSIASAPNLDKRFELTIERLANGEVSPYLTQEVAVGDRLELRGPIGGWSVWRKEQTEPIQLVAGGSGIVPLLSMIRSRAAAGSTAPFRLLYAVCQRYRNRLRLWGFRGHRCGSATLRSASRHLLAKNLSGSAFFVGNRSIDGSSRG